MKGILFKPDIWEAKKAVLDQYGIAVTRRLDGFQTVNQSPQNWVLTSRNAKGWVFQNLKTGEVKLVKSPFHLGEVVYVKEAWHFLNVQEDKASPYDFGIEYKDGEIKWWTDNGGELNYPLDEKYSSPLFMPAKYARDFLQILGDRPERLCLPLSAKEVELEGGEPALKYLEPFNGRWLWRYELKRGPRPEDLQ